MHTRHFVVHVFAFLSSFLGFTSAIQAQVYERVFSFTDGRNAESAITANKGSNPGPLVEASDGIFYGTTNGGGASDAGTAFKLTSTGTFTTLTEFVGTATLGDTNGKAPVALCRGRDGNFYGTTSYGGQGTPDNGTIFKMNSTGQVTPLVLFGLNYPNDVKGKHPGPLIEGTDGNFYGMTTIGGTSAFGTIYKVTPTGVLTNLVEFTDTGGSYKGSYPYGRLMQAADGNFYGTTYYGGASDFGTVFKVTSAGVLTTLVEFTGNGTSNKGANPYGGLVDGGDGNFYGTTTVGGANNYGTIFKMTPAGVLQTLFEFADNGTTNRGRYPNAELVKGPDGSLYGTTFRGGASALGTVFKITLNGTLTTLAEFSGNGALNKGSLPYTPLLLASDGSFYGSTSTGGAKDKGTVFRMTPSGAITTLVEFSGIGTTLGSKPSGGLTGDGTGNYYGVTSAGGANGKGTLYKLSQDGVVSTVVSFSGTGATKGSAPSGELVKGNDGAFYGTTAGGGSSGYGTIYKATSAGVVTTLVEFNDTTIKGATPSAGLVLGNDGNFYGTTTYGGTSGDGTIFKLTPAGALTTLVSLDATTPIYPNRMIQASDGNFYGTAEYGGPNNYGGIFKMTPAGTVSMLLNLTGYDNPYFGFNPKAGVMQASDGALYATDRVNYGLAYKVTLGGAYTSLSNFFDPLGTNNKGKSPCSQLMQAPDGNFYGITNGGGLGVVGSGQNDGYGTVFKMSPSGFVTTVGQFVSISDQASDSPFEANSAPLVAGLDGNLYGTTTGPDGSIFRLVFPGAPLVALRGVELSGSTAAVLRAGVNARGASTDVSLEYGTTVTDLSTSVPVASGLTGYDTKAVGTRLESLNPGTTYYYRFRATSSAGTTVRPSPVASFSTLSEPVATALAASTITRVSGQFNGTVNARNYDTTVSFQWGTDGNSFPNTVGAVPGTVSGNTAVAVSAAPAQTLVSGQTYFYRIVATNIAGTVTSGVQSFITLTDPVATVGSGAPLNATSASVNGSVDARGANTTAVFEYANNAAFTGSLSTPVSPSPVTGIGATAVSATLSGLSPGTTYYFRIVATSSGGSGTSNSGTFTTPPLPATTTVAASGIGVSSATLNGTANANGLSTTVVFETGTDGVNFPNTLSASPGTVAGSSATAVSATVGGLTAGTTYYYRLRGTSSAGTVTSPSVAQFTTLVAPTATTGVASSVTATSSTVAGTVNAKGTSTAVTVEYGTDGVNFPLSVSATPSPVAGSSNTAVSATLSGLTEGVTYYYRVRGTSVAGTAAGSVANFATLLSPVPVLGAPSNVALTGTALNGTVNARGTSTAVTFEYGTDGVTFGSSVAAAPSPVTGSTAVAVSAAMPGLSASTTYFYRLRAASAAATVVTSPTSFTTPTPPSVTIGAASAITATAASVAGSVNAQGASTTVTFEYGTDGVNFPNSVVAVPSPVVGSSAVPLSGALSGLSPGVLYRYRLRATNAGGTTMSSVNTFTTSLLPTVSAVAASGVGVASGTLNGTATANGLTTTVTFEYGTDGVSFPSIVSATPGTVTGSSATAVSATIGGLTAGSTYYYRVRGTSSAGTVLSSSVVQFTTLVAPTVTTGVASSVTATGATVAGMVNANGPSTEVVVEYGTDGVSFPLSVTGTPSPVAGSTSTAVSGVLGGLAQNTKYYYRVRGTSVAGTAAGAVSSFTTLQLPLVVIGSASGVSIAGATLGGSVDARGSITVVTMEVANDAAFTAPNTLPATPSPVTDSGAVAVSATLGSLPAATTFFYRLRAASAAGVVVSDASSFTTPNPPIVSMTAATNLTATSAQVNGTINAAGSSTTVSFEVATDSAFTNPSTLTAAPSPVGGTGDVAVTASVPGLAPGTTYHVRLKATSGGGTVVSSDLPFITATLPSVTGQNAINVGSQTATLIASVDAHGLATSVLFEYGTSADALPFSVAAAPGTVTGSGPVAVSAPVIGLSPETNYFFRVRAVSAAGEMVTRSQNFIMATSARVVTGSGTASLDSATFNGTANGYGQPTVVAFDYGTDPANLDRSIVATPGSISGMTDVPVTATVSGLSQTTTYYYRLKATNGGGTTLAQTVQSVTTETNQAPVANPDLVFYAGSVTFDPLANDTDENNHPPAPANAGLSIQQIVQVPQVAGGVAKIVYDQGVGRFIGYTPQFNVLNDDSLTYRVQDAQGTTADGVVRLVTFAKRAGSYGATLGTSGVIALDFDGNGRITLGNVAWKATATGTTAVYRLKGLFDNSGQIRIPLTIPGGTLDIILRIDPDAGRLTGSITERNTGGVVTAAFDPVELKQNAGTGGLAQAGLRTAFLEAEELAGQVGTGYLLMNVAKNGKTARITGQLPDGQRFGAGVQAAGTTFPLAINVPPKGVLIGMVRVVQMGGSEAGIMANLSWKRVADARLRSAVDTTLEMHGVDYPLLSKNALPPIALGSGMPNARLVLRDGGLGTPLEFPLVITAGNVSGFDPQMLKLKLQPALGTFSGQFRHPLTNKYVPFNGALRTAFDVEPGQGRGVFTPPGATGSVSLLAPSP